MVVSSRPVDGQSQRTEGFLQDVALQDYLIQNFLSAVFFFFFYKIHFYKKNTFFYWVILLRKTSAAALKFFLTTDFV